MESEPLRKQPSRLSSLPASDTNTYHSLDDAVDSHHGNKNTKLNFFQLSTRKKVILISCIMVEFHSGCSFSIMAPFYPREAERKGMNSSTMGFIFSIFELIIFISSPILGNYLTKIGSKFVFLSGIFVGGICTILFGTLKMCPPHAPFIVLSFATRSIQALGFSSYVTASFAIVSSEFPNQVSTAFGILQTSIGIGLMLGPVIGGALYDAGGFGLPFYITGTAVVLNGVLVWCFLPDPNDTARSKRNKSIFSMIRHPLVFFSMLSICTGALGITFLEPTLAKHLEPFGLATVTVSLFFVISPFMNAITSPFWGYLLDTKNSKGLILVSSHLFYSFGFLLLGPSPLLPFIPFRIWIVIVGLVFVGMTLASVLITSMKCMVVGALEQGFAENIDTYGIVAGIFNSMYTLGGFVGPMLGGILSDKFGSSIGFSVVGLIALSMALMTGIFFAVRNGRMCQ